MLEFSGVSTHVLSVHLCGHFLRASQAEEAVDFITGFCELGKLRGVTGFSWVTLLANGRTKAQIKIKQFSFIHLYIINIYWAPITTISLHGIQHRFWHSLLFHVSLRKTLPLDIQHYLEMIKYQKACLNMDEMRLKWWIETLGWPHIGRLAHGEIRIYPTSGSKSREVWDILLTRPQPGNWIQLNLAHSLGIRLGSPSPPRLPRPPGRGSRGMWGCEWLPPNRKELCGSLPQWDCCRHAAQTSLGLGDAPVHAASSQAGTPRLYFFFFFF